MNHSMNTPRDCERSEDLLAYLYREATASERKSFEQHLTQCSACREEHVAFGGVREAFAGWRDESFREAASFYPFTEKQRIEKRSALVAVREFFRLAPVWLQASGVIAALVVCALAASALVNADARREQNRIAFSTSSREPQRDAAPTVDAPSQKHYTQQEVDELIADRVQRGIETYREQAARGSATTIVAKDADRKSSAPDSAASSVSTDAKENGARRRSRTTTTPVGARERQTTVARRSNDDGVPRLSDLLDVVN